MSSTLGCEVQDLSSGVYCLLSRAVAKFKRALLLIFTYSLFFTEKISICALFQSVLIYYRLGYAINETLRHAQTRLCSLQTFRKFESLIGR